MGSLGVPWWILWGPVEFFWVRWVGPRESPPVCLHTLPVSGDSLESLGMVLGGPRSSDCTERRFCGFLFGPLGSSSGILGVSLGSLVVFLGCSRSFGRSGSLGAPVLEGHWGPWGRDFLGVPWGGPSILLSLLLLFVPFFLPSFLPSSLPVFFPASLLTICPYFNPSFLLSFFPSFFHISFLHPLILCFHPSLLLSFLSSFLPPFLPSFRPWSLLFPIDTR